MSTSFVFYKMYACMAMIECIFVLSGIVIINAAMPSESTRNNHKNDSAVRMYDDFSQNLWKYFARREIYPFQRTFIKT